MLYDYDAIFTARIMSRALLILTSALGLWRMTVRYRKRMEKALGRKVDVSELSSLTTWMKATEVEDRNLPKKPPPEREENRPR